VQAEFEDAVGYFLPCFIAQIAFIGWVSQGRVLPILTDASQLLTATEVLKSVAVGLWNPGGQGFKVTAKGGDRSRIVVQWQLMRWFLIATALTLVGILWAFLFDAGRHLEGSSALALFWGWYNIVVLVVTCIVCIELPRRADDLVVGQTLGVRSAGGFGHFEIDRIAGNDIRLLGSAPANQGDVMHLNFGDHEFAGTVQECGRNHFTVEINNSRQDRPLLMHHLYSAAFSVVPNAIDYKSVTSAVLSRAFR
jgi:cellulose synthase (UDP-forming)